MRRIGLATVLLLVISLTFLLLNMGPKAVAQPPDPQPLDLAGMELPPKGHPKMESVLTRLGEVHLLQGVGAARELAQRNGVFLDDSRARLVIVASDGQAQEVTAAVMALGGVVEGTYRDLIQARVPLSALTALADNPQVRFLRRPLKPMPLVVSQGVTLTNAKVWQDVGYTGAGVKVAILDLGFQGYQFLLGTELPSSVITNVFGFGGDITGGGQPHGTAVAEIVYDMAPGATMYLVAADTEVNTANAVNWLCSQGVKVINYSVGWVNTGPGDGTGVLNDIVKSALNCGILWVNAAGNEGQRHWRGTFTDTDSDKWHNFSGADETNTISVGSGGYVVAALSWDDPWGASANDLDLYLYDNLLNLVASSTDVQTGTGYPTELLFAGPLAAGTYHIAVYKYSATRNPTINLFSFYQNLEYQTAAYSLLQPADSRDGMAAGAVYWGTPTVIESFSSQGPTEDGRTKPDISAPDGTAGMTYGAGSFYGTSAAAPHTVGAAALVMQSFPLSTVTQTRAFLEGRAVDLGATGKDNVFGAGRLNLGTPPPTTTAPVASFTAFPLTGTVPITVAFTDTSTGTVITRSWSFGDVATSTAQNPTHTYTVKGVYTVSLTVSGLGSLSDTLTKTSYIHAYNPVTATFTASPLTSSVPLTVAFTDTSSGDVASRLWSFGDGVTSTLQNPTHTYTTGGVFSPSLTVLGLGGDSSTQTRSAYIRSLSSLFADFTGSPVTGPVPLTVAFTDTTTGTEGHGTLSRLWSFGDGTSSALQNPTHTYSCGGIYTVSLQVASVYSSSQQTKSGLVTAVGSPCLDFVANPRVGIPPFNVQFSSTFSGMVTSLAWDFGDGDTSNLPNPSHVYNITGTYTVSLAATGPFGTGVITRSNYITVISTTGATLEGQLTLEGSLRPITNWVVPLSVTMSGNPVNAYVVTTTNTGAFSLPNIIPGTYTVTVVGPHTLINRKKDLAITPPTTTLNISTLREGDANMSGQVNIADFGILVKGYLRSGNPNACVPEFLQWATVGIWSFDKPVSTYQCWADFDASGQVNIADFGLLARNYLRSGPIDLALSP
ncbi:MAG: PKD domain-containing protein [Chloroflexi bacterium]|nr:PKD domain-containing protein [Chloroflexota bacterium]